MVIMNDKMWDSMDSWFSKQPLENVDCSKAKKFLSDLLCYSEGVLFLNWHGCQKFHPEIDIDATGFEGSLNSSHLRDLFDLSPENAPSCVFQYIKLIKELSQKKGVEGKIAFLIGVNEDDEHYDVWVNFHIYRPGEHYLSEDLDGFEEKTMIMVL